MGVTHKPKAGTTLTGTEYEAADSHIVAIAHSDTTGITATDHHAAPAAGPDANVTVDSAGAAGTASTFARSQHGHQVATDATAQLAVTPDGTATAGTSGTIARSQHQHGMATYASTPAAVSTAGSAGTSATAPARGDHTHAHEAAHINHDTTWAAKGDLIAGTANDTAAVLTVGADDTILMADSAQSTGLKWVASATPSTQAFADAAAVGTADTFTRGDHKHAMPTLGYGLSGNSAPAVGLTTASAFITATTSLSASTYADITGASVSLAAGTWLIVANVVATDTTTTAGLLVAAITDGSNNLVAEGAQSIPAGTATVSTWGHVGLAAIVSPSGTTTYKLRGARGTTTATATLVVQDGSPQNVANNASTNTDKGTGIFAVRLA